MTKSNKKFGRTTVVLVCSILGAVVIVGGLLVFGLPLNQIESADETADASPLSPPSNKNATTPSTDITTLAGIQNLKDLEGAGSKFAQQVALYGLLQDANESKLAKLVEQSTEISPTSLQYSTQHAIFQRLASIDPRKALASVEKVPAHRHGSVISAIFAEWSHNSLDDAIAGAAKLDESKKTAALGGIMQSRDDLSDDLRRGIARQLGNEQYALDLIAQSQLSTVSGDPKATWNILVNDDQQDMAQVVMLVETAQAWYEEGGFGALLSMQDSLRDWTTRHIVLGSTIHRMSHDELESAFDKAVVNDQGGRWSIANIVTQAWVAVDPERAFAAVSTLDSGEVKQRLLETVVREWANDDPHVVLERLKELPDNVQRMAQEGAIISIARDDPVEASQLLSNVEGNRARSNIAWNLTSIWVNDDIHAALNWVLTDPVVANMRQQLLGQVLYQLAEVNPQLAFDTALNQPVSENREGLESTVIAYLARTNLQQALDMLSKVRDGRTKVAAYGNVGNELVRQGDVSQALKLAQEFVEPNKTQYLQSIVNTWSRMDPDNLLESMDRLPSSEVQSRAAMTLIASNWRGRRLTDEQLAHAKSFLNEQDAQLVERGRVQVRRGTVIWPRNRDASSPRPTPRRGS